ncbi:MAG TPA: ATP-binding protein [Acidimicrobiales bacterium]|nr:ATP-binding protein [Acidimicrobiales bacterium]
MRRRSVVAPLAILLLGIALSVTVSRDVGRTADRELSSSLERGLSEIGMVIQGLAYGFEAELSSLAAVATVTGGDPALQQQFVESQQFDDGFVLFELAGTDPAVVTAVAPDPANADEQRRLAAILLGDAAAVAQVDDLVARSAFGFVVSQQGLIGLVAGTTSLDGQRYAAARLFDVSENGLFLTDTMAGVDRFAVYVGEARDPSRAVLASTIDLPLSGTTRSQRTDVAEQVLTIEVGGTAMPSFPPVAVGAFGVLLTLVVAGLLSTALRRRDAALRALAAAEAAEEQRAALEGDLQQAQRMETIGQLAGGIAHDFNNLLAAIASTSELVLADLDDPAMQADVEAIIDATQRGARLTKQLLSFSRRGLTRREAVALDPIVEHMADLLRRTLGEHVDLDVRTGAPGAQVVGDPAELEQVLLNLVVNARDAAIRSGTRIEVRTERVGDEVHLRVTDDGKGMAPEVVERAFEPFFSTKHADHGTGLGLSIVYGIATRAGGSVTIDSAPGRGSSVVVSLPCSHAEPVPEAAPVSVSGAADDRELILVVEDEPAVRRAAQRLLERAGHTVVPAADGHEALDHLLDGVQPTVLLTDVVLPGPLSGHDVAERVRSSLPGVRVIYASGYSRDLLSAEQVAAEGARFVAKPFTSQALLAAVADLREPVA